MKNKYYIKIAYCNKSKVTPKSLKNEIGYLTEPITGKRSKGCKK